MSEQDNKKLETIFDVGTNLVGASTGAAVGLVAGPLGAVAGALLGTAAEQIMISVGNEIKSRVLSKRENVRISTVYQVAADKLNSNLAAGKKLRNDDFFKSNGKEMPTGAELLEGTLLVAQREYEEKKLTCLGNLYANIAFTEDVTPQNANMLIKLAESLTYRQLCEIKIIAMFQIYPEIMPKSLKKTAYQSVKGLNNISIASEILELYHKTIVSSKNVLLDAAGINPSELKIVGNGALLLNMMELLTTIPYEDCTEIVKFLTGEQIPTTEETITPGRNTARFG